MIRKYSGSALVDYVVPTAVVGLVVGLGLFGITKSGALKNFFAASGNIDINGTKAVMNANNSSGGDLISSTAGDSDDTGTTKVPSAVKKGNLPSDGTGIDYGDFVLNGIPEDFGDYIEAAGNAGGTDVLADAIRQIAMQANIDAPTQNLLLTLANNGHGLADLEKSIEDEAKTGIEKFKTEGTLSGFAYSTTVDSLSNGTIRNSFNSTYIAAINQLSSSTDPNAKAILDSIKVLGTEIQSIADDMDDVAQTTVDATGGELSSTLTEMLNPDGSKRTDVDSALICASGNAEDSGHHCGN